MQLDVLIGKPHIEQERDQRGATRHSRGTAVECTSSGGRTVRVMSKLFAVGSMRVMMDVALQTRIGRLRGRMPMSYVYVGRNWGHHENGRDQHDGRE